MIEQNANNKTAMTSVNEYRPLRSSGEARSAESTTAPATHDAATTLAVIDALGFWLDA